MGIKASDLPFIDAFTADVSKRAIMVVDGDKLAQMLLSKFTAQYGGTGTGSGSGSGSTGTTNLFGTPSNLSDGGKFTTYQPGGEMTRPDNDTIVIASPFSGPCVLYEEISTTTLVPGQVYTMGYDVTPDANSTGHVTAHADFQGGVSFDSANTSLSPGVTTRLTKSFKVPTGVPNSHVGLRFYGPGRFKVDRVTLVAGSVDNPDAV